MLFSGKGKYKGFVYSDTLRADVIPGVAEVYLVHQMMLKKNRKKTRSQHTLFARGFKEMLRVVLDDTNLMLTTLKGNSSQSIMLELTLAKILHVASVEDMVYLFVQRMGVGCYKCHVLRMETPVAGQTLCSVVLQRIAQRVSRRVRLLEPVICCGRLRHLLFFGPSELDALHRPL
eukprot:m.198689 g.198689  ORF g.198689 m.198689 type:complete len:175 (-) comp53793_c0_seq4:1105-1629(-)